MSSTGCISSRSGPRRPTDRSGCARLWAQGRLLDLSQDAGFDAHRDWLAEELEQDERAMLCTRRLVDGLDAGEGSVGDDHAIASAKELLDGLGLLAPLEQLDQPIIHLRRPVAEAYQPADAWRGADGRPALRVLAGMQTNEKIPGEHGLDRYCCQVPAYPFNPYLGQVALVALVFQVREGGAFLAGLGMDEIPGGSLCVISSGRRRIGWLW